VDLISKSNGRSKNAEKVKVVTWPDGKGSALSLTFDDGYACHFNNVRPVLAQHGFKGTFFIVPQWLDGMHMPKFENRLGTWSDFMTLAREGHEIGSHSLSHLNLAMLKEGNKNMPGSVVHELCASKNRIEEMIPVQRCRTFAYPYGIHDKRLDSLTANFYDAARGLKSLFSMTSCFIHAFLERKIEAIHVYHAMDSAWLDDIQQMKATMRTLFHKGKKLAERFMDTIANPITEHFAPKIMKMPEHAKWTVIITHEVIPMAEIPDADTFNPLPLEWFCVFCEWLQDEIKENDLWVDSFMNVAKYSKERSNFIYKIESETSHEMEITVDDGLDPALYDYPLTIDIAVPRYWETVEMHVDGHDGAPAMLQARDDDWGRVVRIHAIPAGQKIVLTA
jgi:hypothetical protein